MVLFFIKLYLSVTCFNQIGRTLNFGITSKIFIECLLILHARLYSMCWGHGVTSRTNPQNTKAPPPPTGLTHHWGHTQIGKHGHLPQERASLHLWNSPQESKCLKQNYLAAIEQRASVWWEPSALFVEKCSPTGGKEAALLCASPSYSL